MSAWASLIGQAANDAQTLAYKYLDQNIGNHNTSYASNLSKYNSADLTAFASQVGRQDYSWQKKLDYAYDSNQYYDLAKRYAENSASWSVSGLRKAGLNPILAATDGNFSSTYGTGSSGGGSAGGSASNVSASPTSPSSGSHQSFTDTVRDLASASSAESTAALAHVDTETRKQLRDPTVSSAKADVANKNMQNQVLAAERAKVLAEADSVRANTAKTLTDILDTRQGKTSTLWNIPARIINGITDWRSFDERLSDLKKETGVGNTSQQNYTDSSAKSSTRSMPYNGSLEELRKELESELRSSRRKGSFIYTR